VKGPLNDKREAVVMKAFKKFDKDNSGSINIEDLKDVYNSSQHPDVKSGKKTEDQVLYEFLDTFEMHFNLLGKQKKDRNIEFEEFLDYYTNVSCGIDSDDYFELMITNAWNFDNKKYGKGVSMDN
jgi:Ca2+-binding EF-hand superfamily protein